MAVVGADVGTGAACVYPLLGAAHFGWCMLGTETDPDSCSSALRNVEQNKRSGQIAVRKVEEKTILRGALDNPEILAQVSALKPCGGGGGGGARVLPRPPLKVRGPPEAHPWGNVCSGAGKEGKNGHKEEGKKEEEEEEAKSGHKEDKNKKEEENKNGKEEKEGREKGKNGHKEVEEDKEGREDDGKREYTFDFTMANPPFFSSEEEADTMAKSKKGRGEPPAAPTGCMQEKVTEGGEVEFIGQMVKESQLLRHTVRIFTTLIGTKAHVKEVKRLVEAAQPTSSVFTEFCQGRTMRWGAAWTFASGVSLSEVRSKKEMATNKPIVLILPRSLMSVYSVPAAWVKVQGWLKALKVKVEVFKSNKYFVSANIKAFKPTWLHQRRRRRERHRDGHTQQQQGQSGKEGDRDSSSKRKTEAEEEEEEEEEERESKKARIATEEELESGKTEREKMEEEEDEDSEEEEEDIEEEEEGHQEAKLTDKDGRQQSTTGGWGAAKPRRGGLKCILRCNLQVKQTGGLISVEAYYLAGSSGKEGLNQLVQYMRNQLMSHLHN